MPEYPDIFEYDSDGNAIENYRDLGDLADEIYERNRDHFEDHKCSNCGYREKCCRIERPCSYWEKINEENIGK
jgi:hypothetical protein